MKHSLSPHAYGLLVAFSGVLVLCPDTLMIRLLQAQGMSQWSISAWRGVLAAIGLLVFYRLAEGQGSLKRFFRIDRWVVFVTFSMGIQSLAFVLSIANTKVANTLIIVATGPLFTALFAWAFLGERPPSRTWLTIGAAFVGMLVIFQHDLGSGSVVGDALALLTAIGVGITFVILRHRKAVNMMPAMSMGQLLSGIAVMPLAAPFDMTPDAVGLVLLLGLIILPVSLGMLTLGPRYIPAPEVTLLLLMETVLAPFLVWTVIGEAAPESTIAGGVIVLAALAVNAGLGLLRRDFAKPPLSEGHKA